MTKKHWIESDAARRKFWAYAKSDLGLSEDEVHQALNVEHTKDFDGDKAAVVALLQNYAAGIVPRRARAKLIVREPEHAEARTIAFCDLYAPDGTKIALTAREGVTHDELVRVALSLTDAAETLVNVFGFSAAPQKYTNNNKRSATPKPPAPARPTPPPAPGSGEHTPPAPPGHPHHLAGRDAPPPPAGNGQPQGGVIQTEFIKITAPKGKPVVEFWRPNRKYYEIRWQLGGAKLLAIAPTLAAVQWQATHFSMEAVGQEYQLPVNVHWTPSKPDGKYKDITLVELR